MSAAYRSRYWPPLAHGGHVCVVVDWGNDDPSLADPTVRPAWLRCARCYWQGPEWALRERFYPMPCRGLLRALDEGE